jgi:hypothetical protein
MQVKAIQVCQGQDIIAELREDHGLPPRWYVQIRTDAGWSWEIVDDLQEVQQLERVIEGDTTGYMVFRTKEYEDVVVCVIR